MRRKYLDNKSLSMQFAKVIFDFFFSILLLFSLHSVIDIINIFVTDDRLYNAVIELPEKASFVSTVTTLVTSKHFELIRSKLIL